MYCELQSNGRVLNLYFYIKKETVYALRERMQVVFVQDSVTRCIENGS